MTRLSFRLDRTGPAPRLALGGELDITGIERLEAALASIEAEKPPEIVLDLRGVSFIDSGGLSALLDADARARRAGRRLLVTPPPTPIMRMLRLTLLDRRFDWVETPPRTARHSEGERDEAEPERHCTATVDGH